MADSYYSKTQRIVLLIDLSPLLHLRNPDPFLHSLLKSAHILLGFQPLSQSLSSFRLFFSSLSPLFSSSTLVRILSKSSQSSSYYNPNSLSFNRSQDTLNSLAKTLDLVTDLNNSNDCAGVEGASRADFAASSLLQVVQDYAWEVQLDSDSFGLSSDSLDAGLLDFVPSNLVILFSPICRSFKDLTYYIRVNSECKKDGISAELDTFADKFVEVFQHVNFVARDIHICWVDTNYEEEISLEKVHSDDDDGESRRLLEFFQSGLRSLGWGFSSTSSIVLGSALVPFGLVYPSIGVLPKFHHLVNKPCKKVVAQLNLEISDAKGEPLQCKCCDLQLLDLKPPDRPNSTEFLPYKRESLSFESKVIGDAATSVWECLVDSIVQVDIKTIWRGHDTMMIKGNLSKVVLVYESFGGESKRVKMEPGSREFFADKVLGILSKETNETVKKISQPPWPILLSFLYRGGYLALVSISSSNGSSCMGILKPFTVQSAFLFLVTSDITAASERNYGGLKMDHNNTDDSQLVRRGGENKRKNKNHPPMYDQLWSSFCKSALGQSKLELEEAYFNRSSEISKKLKFIKCWMKQTSRSIHSTRCSFDLYKNATNKEDELDKRINSLSEERRVAVPSSFPQEIEIDSIPEQPLAERCSDASLADSSDAYFSYLGERIRHGLESGVDLETLAQRLVKSSIHWLSKKLVSGNNFESQPSADSSAGNGVNGKFVKELVSILLKDSAQISEKHKENAQLSSEDRIREYELQILFRLEILQSDIADGVKDSLKRKFIKQICSFLERIQCNVEEGFFGNFNLHDYVGKIIKRRYSQKLGDVSYKICEKMDLLLFDYDDEAPNSLLNSEESSQSWREQPKEHFDDSNNKATTPLSSENNSSGRLEEEARVKRERARRFSSFTRGVPVLQRVWAPKRQKKPSTSKLDSLQKSRSRSSRIKFPENCDKVCETPMMGKMHSLSKSNDLGIRNDQDVGGDRKKRPPSSVFKALFIDD